MRRTLSERILKREKSKASRELAKSKRSLTVDEEEEKREAKLVAQSSLSNIALFNDLSSKDKENLVSVGESKTYSGGTVIFSEGEKADVFYTILKVS